MGCKPCVFVHHYLILLHQGCGIRNAHPRIDTKEELQKRVKQQRIESIAVAFAVVVLTMYDRGIPHTFFAWLKMILLFIVCGGVLFLLRYVIVKLAYRRAVKEEIKKKSS